MSFQIINGDITKMECDAVVCIANSFHEPGKGGDSAIYKAAGYAMLANARKQLGELAAGEAAITLGFYLPSKYVIHAASPVYIAGFEDEEEKLRSCYRNSIKVALEHKLHSIAFTRLSDLSFGYPKEEADQILIEELETLGEQNDIDIFLVEPEE